MSETEPQLIAAGASTDDRGRVLFANDFDLSQCRRLYIVENFAAGHRAGLARSPSRAQVGDGGGGSGARVLRRRSTIGKRRPRTQWSTASRSTRITRRYSRFPPAYANGAMALLPETKLLYFSDASLEESLGDDIRYPARYWDPWQVAER